MACYFYHFGYFLQVILPRVLARVPRRAWLGSKLEGYWKNKARLQAVLPWTNYIINKTNYPLQRLYHKYHVCISDSSTLPTQRGAFKRPISVVRLRPGWADSLTGLYRHPFSSSFQRWPGNYEGPPQYHWLLIRSSHVIFCHTTFKTYINDLSGIKLSLSCLRRARCLSRFCNWVLTRLFH